MNIPADLKYTRSHEWIKQTDSGTWLVGLTDHAQSEMGDLVFVNLPAEGDLVTAGESFADIESVKAVSDIYSPLGGAVKAVNEELIDDPSLINSECYGAWFVEVEGDGTFAELLSAEEYEAYLEEEA